MNKEIKNQVQTELKQNGNAGPGTELVNKEREEKLSENEVFELIQKIKEIEEQKE
ncbi:20751_t:CDS:1, partial [Gigaspora rosea]